MSGRLLPTGSTKRGGHNYHVFTLCPRQWAYMEAGIEADNERDSEALAKGSAMHAGLAHWYGSRLWRDLASPADAVRASLEADGALKYATEVESTLAHYCHTWALDMQRYNVLYVEKALGWRTPKGSEFTARFDLVLEERSTGRILVLDHKTGARMNPKALQEFATTLQSATCSFLGKKLTGKPVHVVMNRIVWPDANGVPRFAREPIPPRPKVEAQIPQMLDYYAAQQDMLAGREPDAYPPNFTACRQEYDSCPFLGRCQGI